MVRDSFVPSRKNRKNAPDGCSAAWHCALENTETEKKQGRIRGGKGRRWIYRREKMERRQETVRFLPGHSEDCTSGHNRRTVEIRRTALHDRARDVMFACWRDNVMTKWKWITVFAAVCLLALCVSASAEIVVSRSRDAHLTDEPFITGALNPMTGESYVYTIHNGDKVDGITLTLYLAEEEPENPGRYSLNYHSELEAGEDYTFPVTFTQEATYVIWMTCSKDGNDMDVHLFVNSVDRSAEIGQKIAQIADACRQSGASTDYEKAVWLHDWLTGHAYYDLTYTEHGPDGVLLKGYGVCESYSKAYKMLLDEFGIPNYCQDGTSRGENHEWNVVKLDGEWCHVDVTWDDPSGDSEAVSGKEKYTYFGLPDELLGVDHDYNITYPCQTWENIYYLRYGLPDVYDAIIDEGWDTPGLIEQAAQGLDPISVDVSGGYCVSYEETAEGWTVSQSKTSEHIIFPVMAILKSRVPLTGPDGEDVYYTFTYENQTLTGVKTEAAQEGPILRMTYLLDGKTVQPGATFEVGKTLTVNWEVSLGEWEDGTQYYLYFETPVTLNGNNEVMSKHILRDGEFNSFNTKKIITGSASGTFSVTPNAGDLLTCRKTLKGFQNGDFVTLKAWEEDEFTLTGNETEPVHVDVAFTQAPESRTITAQISTDSTQYFQPVWYADVNDSSHELAGDGKDIEGEGISRCCVTRNAGLVILSITIHDNEKGMEYREDFPVVLQGFGTLPENACGKNVTWTMENEALVLTGTGAMFDYPQGGAPWYGSRGQITSVHVPEGVTYLGTHAFEFTKISEIVVPDSVESIAKHAFLGCSSLRSAYISKGVRELDKDAFYLSSKLTEFVVDEENPYIRSVNHMVVTGDGENLVAIPEGAESLVIPEGVTVIDPFSSFSEGHAKSITIPVSVKEFNAQFIWQGSLNNELKDVYYQGTRKQFSEIRRPEGRMFPAGDNVTVHFAPTPEDKTLVLPADLKTIEEQAFTDMEAEEVVIPAGTVSVGALAFSDSASLILVRIPDSVTEIADNAFSGCHPDLLVVGKSGSEAERFASAAGLFFETAD